MIKNISLLLVRSNLFVSIGVWSLVMLTGFIRSIDLNDFAIFSFFSTMLVYSFSSLYYRVRDKGIYSLLTVDNLLLEKVLFGISILAMPYYIFSFSIEVLLMLVPVAIVSFMYPVGSIKVESSTIAIREVPYVRIFLIGISWGVVTVLLPIVNYGYVIDFPVITEFLVRSMFVIAITIPFDIRDKEVDSPSMKTIPQSFGVDRSKMLSYVLLLINLAYFIYVLDASIAMGLSVFISLLITAMLVWKSNSKRPQSYFAILMEGTSVLLYISICCFS